MNIPEGVFEHGAVVISIDTEQIWGHFDITSEEGFRSRYSKAVSTHDRLLDCLCAADISATWAVVGGLSLSGSAGAVDSRMAGLPETWTASVPPGDETTTPLWYRRRFVVRLRDASPAQEVGLHGGLTHLVWGVPDTSAEMARRELLAGIRALREIGIEPRSFVFPRDLEAHHEVLAEGGIHCFRGRAPILSERLGYNLAGSIARALEELGRLTPPPIWPEEVLPGLWNIPASLFLYPMGRARGCLVPLRLRLDRVRRGVEAAARSKGIFHLGLHPENLAESSDAFATFQSIVEHLVWSRDEQGVEILTMGQALDRVKGCDRKLVTV